MDKKAYLDGVNLDLFDRVEIYRPDLAHLRRIVFVPGKVMYINRAADADANILKLAYYEDELLELLLDDLV